MKNYIKKISLCALWLIFFTHTILPPGYAEIDDYFLEKIAQDSFHYFLTFTPRKTGLTRDSSAYGSPCSIAGVGFYLATLVVATHNQWLDPEETYGRIETVFNTLRHKAEGKNGFYYHFIDPVSCKRVWGSEISSIDTALLMAGVLLAGEYFDGTPLEKAAHELYNQVQWNWMLNRSQLMCHGYKPETGFLPYYWDSYSEHIILQALAIGSPTYPIPPAAWNSWNRYEEEVDGKRIVYASNGSLFTYQFAHAFIDFRTLFDLDINYFKNSTNATLANRSFCREHAGQYETYKQKYWGLTASLGPSGYKAYGAPPGNAMHDGTVAPYGSIASLPFTPRESYAALERMYGKQYDTLYGPFGFRDAFNVDKAWYARDYLAIDQGTTVVMIENFRTGLIWKYFMRLEPVQRWVRLCELERE